MNKEIDVGFRAQLEQTLPGQTDRRLFRVRTTERQRLTSIEVNRDFDEFRWYLVFSPARISGPEVFSSLPALSGLTMRHPMMALKSVTA